MKSIKHYKPHKTKERENYLKQALYQSTKPISDEDLEALKVNGRLELEVFKDNVAKIFPRVLLMVTEGASITKIEAFLGLNEQVLSNQLKTRPRLYREVKKARKLGSDKRRELKFLLS